MAEDTQESQLQLDARDLGALRKSVAAIREETGCDVELPPEGTKGSKHGGPASATLRGSPEQVRRARDVIDGVLCGEAVKDVIARQRGAQILKNLHDDAMSYIADNLQALESEHGMTLELGDHCAYVYGGAAGTASAARAALEEAVAHLTENVTETVVLPRRFTQAMVRQLRGDMTLRCLLDSVRPRVEDTVAKSDEGTAIRLRGVRTRVADAKALLERLCRCRGADFVGLCPGLLSQMGEATAGSLQRDLGCLEEESGAAVEAQWDLDRVALSGEEGAMAFAKRRLRDVLHFYFPEEFASVWAPPQFSTLSKELLRLQRARIWPLDVQLDEETGLVWFSGAAEAVGQARQQLLDSLRKGGLHEQLTGLKEQQLEGEAGQQLRDLQACAVVSLPPELAEPAEGLLGGLRAASAGLRLALDGPASSVLAAGRAEAVERVCEELMGALRAADSGQEAHESPAASFAWLTLDEGNRSVGITGSKEAVAEAKREVLAVLSTASKDGAQQA